MIFLSCLVPFAVAPAPQLRLPDYTYLHISYLCLSFPFNRWEESSVTSNFTKFLLSDFSFIKTTLQTFNWARPPALIRITSFLLDFIAKMAIVFILEIWDRNIKSRISCPSDLTDQNSIVVSSLPVTTNGFPFSHWMMAAQFITRSWPLFRKYPPMTSILMRSLKIFKKHIRTYYIQSQFYEFFSYTKLATDHMHASMSPD